MLKHNGIYVDQEILTILLLMQVEEAVIRYDDTCLPPSHADNALAYIKSDSTNKTCTTKWIVSSKFFFPLLLLHPSTFPCLITDWKYFVTNFAG